MVNKQGQSSLQARRWLASIFFLFTLIAIPSLAIADPITRVNRSVIAIDDPLTFTIRINETGSFKGPDLSPLEKDFHVLSNSQSSRHMIRNGRSESWTEWAITLMAKRKGQLTIPSITVGGQKTQASTIQVQPSVPHSAADLQPVFMESEISASSVYVQQQLIFTLRIFQSIQLDNMNISEPAFDNAAVEKLGQNSFQRNIQNTPYRVHELQYAIFPQETGELIIPEQTFTASAAVSRRSRFNLPGQGKPIRKVSQQHTITVKPPATRFKNGNWLPAESIKLTQTWSSSLGNIHVGDSITRSITLKAEGLMDSQLPPYEFPAMAGAKFYPDQGSTETSATDNGVSSTRTDSAAIIPTREGELQLPEIRINWWDTRNNKLQQAVIPASTITVKAALEQAQSNSTPLAIDHSQATTTIPSTATTSTGSDKLFWQLLSAGLATLWLLTLYLLWCAKRGPSNTQPPQSITIPVSISEKQAFKNLLNVCRQNDAQKIRQAIIEWGQRYWPEDNIQTLQDIQHHCDHPSLSTALLQLDNTLYGNSADSSCWNGESLLSAIRLVRESSKKTAAAAGLSPLYKNN